MVAEQRPGLRQRFPVSVIGLDSFGACVVEVGQQSQRRHDASCRHNACMMKL